MAAWVCVAAVALALLAGAEADLWLVWRWSRRPRGMPRGWTDDSLRARPWQPVDVALLLGVLLLLALPALARAIHPGDSAPLPPPRTLILEGLLGYAIVGVALALALWRTRAGRSILLGDRTPPSAALRAGLLYGLAAVPPVLLASWGVSILLQRIGLCAPPQEVFDWLGDPTLSAGARFYLICAAMLLGPLAEELLFRGVFLPALLRDHAPAYAILLLNLLFALLHFSAPTFLPLFLVGVAFSLGMRATGSVLTPIAMHAVFNGEMLLLFLAFPQLATPG